MKKMLLSLLPLLLLASCASGRVFLPPIAKVSEEAKAAVPFCDAAKSAWGEAVDGDPGRTRAQKAAYNATGQALCKGWPT